MLVPPLLLPEGPPQEGPEEPLPLLLPLRVSMGILDVLRVKFLQLLDVTDLHFMFNG